MRNPWIKLSITALIVLLTALLVYQYVAVTLLPAEITIATGLEGGRFYSLGQSIKAAIEKKHGVRVHVLSTDGSLDNLKHLHTGKADFAIYQPYTLEIFHELDRKDALSAIDFPIQDFPFDIAENIQFAANLYYQVVHLIIRNDLNVDSPTELTGKTINVGTKYSGNLAMSFILLDHFRLDFHSIDIKFLTYEETIASFADGSLDAMFLTIGSFAPILTDPVIVERCRIAALPYAKVLLKKRLFVSEYEIPQGLYHLDPPFPSEPTETVSIGAHLLCRKDIRTGMVEAVSQLILDREFITENRLSELYDSGIDFARLNQEFPIHQGARNIYEPEFRPFLNPDFVESTEGIRSFFVSIIIFVILTSRWMKKIYARKKEHKLDRFIRALMDIETRQAPLDEDPDKDDSDRLQKLLDEVTELKQDALREFTVHELNEDRGVDCFIEMCFALSNKINAKLSRQRLDRKLSLLIGSK